MKLNEFTDFPIEGRIGGNEVIGNLSCEVGESVFIEVFVKAKEVNSWFVKSKTNIDTTFTLIRPQNVLYTSATSFRKF